MVGTVIVFKDPKGQWRKIEFVPAQNGFELRVNAENGQELLTEKVVIPKENVKEIKEELIHIL